MPKLTLQNRNTEQVFVVFPGATLGRDPDCTIVIDGSQASRVHARIVQREHGWAICDLGSRNGTWVNGVQVHEAALTPGAVIAVGGCELALVDAASNMDRDPRAVGGPTSQDLSSQDSPSQDPSSQNVRIPEGEERCSLEEHRHAETEWPHRAPSLPIVSRFEALYRGAVIAGRAESPDDVLQGLAEIVQELFSSELQTIWWNQDAPRGKGESGAELSIRYTYPPNESHAHGPRSSKNRAYDTRDLAQRAFEEKAALMEYADGGTQLASALRVPQKRYGAIVIRIAAEHANGLSKEDLELFVACVNQAALGVDAVSRRRRLQQENQNLRSRLSGKNKIVGDSRAIQHARELIRRAATTSSTVLIQGESGTGKELVAEAIHRAGPRADGPFVAVNCGSLTSTLVQSELFGHEKGAFTGAQQRHVGYFERAQGGTLFLDEIAELPLDAQVRLLRVLETWSVTRVGGVHDIRLDVRLVAATHRNLAQMVKEGSFREDLYYRVQVLVIETPPLRERPEDLPALCEHLLESIGRKITGPTPSISSAAIDTLACYSFPGNIRELRNILERATILGSGGVIQPSDLTGLRSGTDLSPNAALGSTPAPGSNAEQKSTPSASRSLRDVEREHIRGVLESVGWNKTRAAEILGIKRQTVHEKVRVYELEPPRPTDT